jgi:hypothetical protein
LTLLSPVATLRQLMRIVAFTLFLYLACLNASGEWKVITRQNPDGPGRAVDAQHDGEVVARLIYGEGQMKPYLHVLGKNGELLTNPGTDKAGQPTGQYPHHRGIFIGWKIISELGTDDLWHMRRGCKMDLVKVQKTEGTKNAATISAEVHWRSARETNGSDLLIRETRTFVISRPAPKRTQVDATFALEAQRDLRLDGDLQHSGVHFRAADEVSTREKQTLYLSEPENVSKGNDLKWCRLIFPIGENWYSALQLNAPTNPVEEISTRNYGRFGYFFKKRLSKGENLNLTYRFVIDEIDKPANSAMPSAEQLARWREDAQRLYDGFASR